MLFSAQVLCFSLCVFIPLEVSIWNNSEVGEILVLGVNFFPFHLNLTKVSLNSTKCCCLFVLKVYPPLELKMNFFWSIFSALCSKLTSFPDYFCCSACLLFCAALMQHLNWRFTPRSHATILPEADTSHLVKLQFNISKTHNLGKCTQNYFYD